MRSPLQSDVTGKHMLFLLIFVGFIVFLFAGGYITSMIETQNGDSLVATILLCCCFLCLSSSIFSLSGGW